jgi:inorganic pyrophosphatase
MADLIDVVIETPRGSRNKYEHDAETDAMYLDRRLPGSFAFPADYGFVPTAVGSDGEPLDAIVLTVEPTYPGIRVRARPVGIVWLKADGRREAKLICVPAGEPAYEGVGDLADLPAHLRDEITNFFDIYRSLDAGSSAHADGEDGAEVARRVLRDSTR